MEVPKEVQEKLEQFELLRQTLLNIVAQKNLLKQQLDEVENALKELEKLEEGKKVYKLVGNILIEKSKEDLINELNNRKEILNIRISSLEKQEERLKERLEKLQKELEKYIKPTS